MLGFLGAKKPLVSRVTSRDPAPPKLRLVEDFIRAVEFHVTRDNNCQWLITKIQGRPLYSHPVVAFKIVWVIHQLSRQATLEPYVMASLQPTLTQLARVWGLSPQTLAEATDDDVTDLKDATVSYANYICARIDTTGILMDLTDGNWNSKSVTSISRRTMSIPSVVERLLGLSSLMILAFNRLLERRVSLFFPLYVVALVEFLSEGPALLVLILEYIEDIIAQDWNEKSMEKYEQPIFRFLGHFTDLTETSQLLSTRYPELLAQLQPSRHAFERASVRVERIFRRVAHPVAGFFSTAPRRLSHSSNSRIARRTTNVADPSDSPPSTHRASDWPRTSPHLQGGGSQFPQAAHSSNHREPNFPRSDSNVSVEREPQKRQNSFRKRSRSLLSALSPRSRSPKTERSEQPPTAPIPGVSQPSKASDGREFAGRRNTAEFRDLSNDSRPPDNPPIKYTQPPLLSSSSLYPRGEHHPQHWYSNQSFLTSTRPLSVSPLAELPATKHISPKRELFKSEINQSQFQHPNSQARKISSQYSEIPSSLPQSQTITPPATIFPSTRQLSDTRPAEVVRKSIASVPPQNSRPPTVPRESEYATPGTPVTLPPRRDSNMPSQPLRAPPSSGPKSLAMTPPQSNGTDPNPSDLFWLGEASQHPRVLSSQMGRAVSPIARNEGQNIQDDLPREQMREQQTRHVSPPQKQSDWTDTHSTEQPFTHPLALQRTETPQSWRYRNDQKFDQKFVQKHHHNRMDRNSQFPAPPPAPDRDFCNLQSLSPDASDGMQFSTFGASNVGRAEPLCGIPKMLKDMAQNIGQALLPLEPPGRSSWVVDEGRRARSRSATPARQLYDARQEPYRQARRSGSPTARVVQTSPRSPTKTSRPKQEARCYQAVPRHAEMKIRRGRSVSPKPKNSRKSESKNLQKPQRCLKAVPVGPAALPAAHAVGTIRIVGTDQWGGQVTHVGPQNSRPPHLTRLTQTVPIHASILNSKEPQGIKIPKREVSVGRETKHSQPTPAPPQQFGVPRELEVDMEEVVIDRMIGKGATSQVFKASWRGVDVAVKRILSKSSDFQNEDKRKSSLKEFYRELGILLRLRHPNLVLFMGTSTKTKPLCVITEFCAGGNLFELLHGRVNAGSARKPKFELSWNQKVKVCLDIARAGLYLHTSTPPIIHRDLKSLNVLLTEEVPDCRTAPFAKVSDFGLSRVKKSPSNWGYLTGMAGTYHWMAPEVLQNNSYTEKADIYSYSIVMYEILSQHIPYASSKSSPMGIAVEVSKGLRPDLAAIPRGCPKDLLSLMVSCWDSIPSRRPSFDRIVSVLVSLE